MRARSTYNYLEKSILLWSTENLQTIIIIISSGTIIQLSVLNVLSPLPGRHLVNCNIVNDNVHHEFCWVLLDRSLWTWGSLQWVPDENITNRSLISDITQYFSWQKWKTKATSRKQTLLRATVTKLVSEINTALRPGLINFGDRLHSHDRQCGKSWGMWGLME